jgi:hypothetical protein
MTPLMTDLPKNLAKPRRDAQDIRLWANIIVGGVLMIIVAGMLAYAILLR